MKAIDQDSRQLAEALVNGTMIVSTTLQKIPVAMRDLLRICRLRVSSESLTEAEQTRAAERRQVIAGRRYAVIVDRGALQPDWSRAHES